MKKTSNTGIDNASSKKEITGAVRLRIRGAITHLLKEDPSNEKLEKALNKATKILSSAINKHFKREAKEKEDLAELAAEKVDIVQPPIKEVPEKVRAKPAIPGSVKTRPTKTAKQGSTKPASKAITKKSVNKHAGKTKPVTGVAKNDIELVPGSSL